MKPIDTETLEFSGRQFSVKIYHDEFAESPCDSSDGHGSVRYCANRETPARGEIVLCDDRHGRWVYDFGAALLKASREKWGLSDEALKRLTARLGKKPTRGQIRAEAVREDMRYLRGWYASDWHYLRVECTLLSSDGSEIEGATDSLWGVESLGDYWRTVAGELAESILFNRVNTWRKALAEARQRKYWNSRDVQTVGA